MTTRGNIKWSRKLYLKQPLFPDNHVDEETFLVQLQRNVNVPVYTLPELIKASSGIVQQLAVIASFIAAFVLVLEGRLGVDSLIMVANGSTVLAYGTWVVYVRNEIKGSAHESKDREDYLRKRGRETIMHGLIFTLLLMLFSPILKTLTEDTSSDTIWAISSLLFLLCWMARDYSRKDLPSGDLLKQYTSPFSLNCAMLASITLASRLPTVTHVFGFLSLAVNLFAFFPILSRMIRKFAGDSGDAILSIVSVAFSFSLWFTVFPPVAFIFGFAVIFIYLICPIWLICLQKYKKYRVYCVTGCFLIIIFIFLFVSVSVVKSMVLGMKP